jgi:hypothetical protein
MFTTRIGPPNISDEYRQMLRGGVVSNLKENPSLIDVLTARVGAGSVEGLENAGFDVFFKLAISKLLAAMFMEEDWHVDSTEGIVMYEFERPGDGVPFKMLHLVMDVRRNDPPKETRRPGEYPMLLTLVQDRFDSRLSKKKSPPIMNVGE